MQCRHAISIAAIAGALVATPASAFDDAKYPDVSGQWVAVRIPGVGGQPAFDPYKPWGRGQEAPLTPEYKAVHERSLADQEAGGQGGWLTGSNCYPPGMPGMMNLYQAMQIVVLPEITYVLIDHAHDSHRRIYTDGRDWPKEPDATFLGYSIGKWIDEDGDGRYDVLEVETRNFKGPRTLDPSGMPTHADNQSVVNERIYLRQEQSEAPDQRDHAHRPRLYASVESEEDLHAQSGRGSRTGSNTTASATTAS